MLNKNQLLLIILIVCFSSCESAKDGVNEMTDTLEAISSGDALSGDSVTQANIQSEYPRNDSGDTYNPGCYNPKLVKKRESKLYADFRRKGGDPVALKQAICFMEKNQKTKFQVDSAAGNSAKIGSKCKIVLNDFSKSTGSVFRKNKMYRINRCTGKIDVSYVAQGSGGVGDTAHRKKNANEDDSGATLRGFHLLGGKHDSGKYKGIKIHGLQKGINNRSYKKSVVIHRGEWTTNNDSGHSLGCPATTQGVLNDLKKNFMGSEGGSSNGDTVKGILMYNYTKTEKKKGKSYCGDTLWKK